jgi:S1-C subfamily serine protease
MSFWRHQVLTIVAILTATVGLAAGIFDTSAVVDKGADAYLTWAESRGVPTWVSSVIQIRAYDEHGETYGSGVILNTLYVKSQKQWHTYVLTAAHVILQASQSAPAQKDATRCKGHSLGLISPDILIRTWSAEVLKWDTDFDLALLKIVTPDYPRSWLQERYVDIQPVTLSSRVPKPAEEVWAVGFTENSRVITRGYVGVATGDALSHSAVVVPGNSGGGVFQNGKLVGINVSRDCDPVDGPNAVPIRAVGTEAILSFLGDEYSDLAETDSVMQWVLNL